ncbi:MAG: transglycosylase SLT domain-containing protein [Rhodobacteraceae bacterium]|nr:transglycosylase SLT domain-containing protein [Paracoccaceae bacterium]
MRLFCIFIPVIAATPCTAGQSNPCDDAARRAAMTHAVPEAVLMAITRVETGRDLGGELAPWPWAVNMGGEGYWPETRDSALALAEGALQNGRQNMDIGCFQLNIRWHAQAFASLEDMFDPVRNAEYAAGFLARLHDETGSWIEAVAAYHSRSPDLAEAYVARVEAVLNAAGPLPDAARDNPTPARENLFPLLQPGISRSPGSLVPGRSGATPLIGAES